MTAGSSPRVACVGDLVTDVVAHLAAAPRLVLILPRRSLRIAVDRLPTFRLRFSRPGE